MNPGIQWGEGLFFFGVAWRLAAWLLKTSRELQAGGDIGPQGVALMTPRPKPTTLQSVGALTASMTPEQQARVISMITETPSAATGHEIEHRCPKCGTLVHADIVNGGFAPCRKCGWSSSAPTPPPSAANQP